MTSVVAPIIDPRAVRLAEAADPMPSAIERGPVARLNWRHGLDVDPALAATVVDDPSTPAEWPALLSEAHASLLDPANVRPLDVPSPVGRSVLDTLRANDAWPVLADAARAHPLIAREAVLQLADVVLSSLRQAGAKETTDTRGSFADLEAARRAVEAARAAKQLADASKDPARMREALRDAVTAQEAHERASAKCAVDDGIATRTGKYIDAQHGAIERIAENMADKAEALNVMDAALGDAVGIGGARPMSDDLVRMLSKKTVNMLRMVGALRAALSAGRSTRHVRGREGMIGVTTGGIDHASDLTAMSLAGLSGALGAPYAALTTLALVEDRADVVEKGGGIARNGHVVLVVDQSGSTRGVRQEWISALALAIILEARKDDRSVGLVTYNGAVLASLVIDNGAKLTDAIRALCREAGGDNNECAALVAAGKLLGAMPHGGDPADVVMITDGQWDAANLMLSDGAGGSVAGGISRARLRGVFVGGAAPVGAEFASTWSVRGEPSPTGDLDIAIEIASAVV